MGSGLLIEHKKATKALKGTKVFLLFFILLRALVPLWHLSKRRAIVSWKQVFKLYFVE